MPMMTRAFSLYLVISGSSLEGLILRRNGSTFVNNSGDDNHDDNDSNDDDNDDDNDSNDDDNHDDNDSNDDDNHDDNDSNDDDNDDNITLSLYFSYFWLLGTLSSMR